MLIPNTKAQRHRRNARLYIAMAERHRGRGNNAQLVSALVRAAWREHEQADATCTELRSPAYVAERYQHLLRRQS